MKVAVSNTNDFIILVVQVAVSNTSNFKLNCGRGDVDDDQKRGSSTTRVEYDIIKIRNKTNNLPTEGEVGHRDGGVDPSAHHLVKYVYLYVYLSPVVYKVDFLSSLLFHRNHHKLVCF